MVAITNAWVQEADPKAKANAGYMTLVNVGSENVTLANVESEAFAKIKMHEMINVDGLMKMRENPNVAITAQGQVRFEPGGKHLMLMGPQMYFTAGLTVEMTLTFQSGRTQTVSVKVAAK